MKECIICGTKAEDSAKVCEVCGSSDFESEGITKAAMQAEEEPIYSNDPDSVYRVRKKLTPTARLNIRKQRRSSRKSLLKYPFPAVASFQAFSEHFCFRLQADCFMYLSISSVLFTEFAA